MCGWGGTRLFLACRHNDANYDKLIELNDCLIAASSAQPGQRAGHGGLTAECEYGGHVSAELQCPSVHHRGGRTAGAGYSLLQPGVD